MNENVANIDEHRATAAVGLTRYADRVTKFAVHYTGAAVRVTKFVVHYTGAPVCVTKFIVHYTGADVRVTKFIVHYTGADEHITKFADRVGKLNFVCRTANPVEWTTNSEREVSR